MQTCRQLDLDPADLIERFSDIPIANHPSMKEQASPEEMIDTVETILDGLMKGNKKH